MEVPPEWRCPKGEVPLCIQFDAKMYAWHRDEWQMQDLVVRAIFIGNWPLVFAEVAYVQSLWAHDP